MAIKKKSAIVIILLSVLIMLSGCSESTEVRNKVFIREMGADYKDTQYIALRTFDSDNVIHGSGRTLLSAVDNCKSQHKKNLFAGHLEVFAVSPEKMAENLLTLLSNNRISPSCYVICVPDSASSFIENNGGNLAEQIESSGRNGAIIPKNISDVINDLLESDHKAAIPTYKNNKLTMAVTDSDHITGVLTDEESEGLCWLCGTLSDIYIPIENENFRTDFYVRKSSSKITADKSDNKINITVEIKINGNAENDISNSEEVKKEVSRLISSKCSRTIAKTVFGMKADLFGIEKSINSENIVKNTGWENIIPALSFSYRIKISE